MSKNRSKKAKNKKNKSANQAPSGDTALETVESLLKRKLFAEAIDLARQISTPHIRLQLEQWGKFCMKAKNFDAAVSFFQLVAEIARDDEKAHNGLAMAYFMAGYRTQALEEMKYCVELAPDAWNHRLNLGKLYLMLEDWRQASIELQLALKGASQEKHDEIREFLNYCQQRMDQSGAAPGENLAQPESQPTGESASQTADAAPDIDDNQRHNLHFSLPTGRQNESDTPLEVEVSAKPLNILFVQEAPCIRNYKMAVALRGMGHRVSLAYTKAKLSQMYPGLSDDTYDQCINVKSFRQLWDMSGSYDLVHCHNEPDVLSVAAFACSAPVIHDTHDLISLRAGGDENLAFFEGLANRGAQGRVYSTKYQRDEAEKLYGVKGPSLVFLNYISKGDSPAAFLPKRSEQDGSTHIVYEGGIGGNAHRNFINLFDELSQAGLHIHVYPNRYDDQLAAFFGKNANIHYYQPLSPQKIMEEMTRYDIGIIPFNLTTGNRRFLDSTIANKLFEYLAAGLPVVASNLVSYREYFAENPVGLTFESASDILGNLDKLREIADKNDLIAHALTYEGEIKKLESFYFSVMQQAQTKVAS